MVWNLRDNSNCLISPLKFENGKNQEDIINEIIEGFEDNSLIFLDAQVGSGKSSIALSLIDYFGKGIINCPTKVLQSQYKEDYTEKYHIPNLKISIMQGRQNFYCPYGNCKASNQKIPCIRKLKKKETRWKVANRCPDWSPVFPYYTYKKIVRGTLFDIDNLEYESVDGPCVYVIRGGNCKYYNQFQSYTDEKIAIIMNSQKWLIETLMGRKPVTDIEIIDEADLFLDSLAFNLTISHSTLDYIELAERRKFRGIKKLHSLISSSNFDKIDFLDTLKKILNSCISNFAQNISFKTSLMLLNSEETKVDNRKDFVVFQIAKSDKIFQSLLEKSANRMLLMSATPTSDDVFSIMYRNPVKFISGETTFPGTLRIIKTGKEININYNNWNDVKDKYWNVLNYLIDIAEKPILCNVFSYNYLPSVKLRNIPSSDDVKKNQDKYIKKFLAGKEDILFTTKMDRGMDLKNEMCRSIILMKYPYPDITSNQIKMIKKYYSDIEYRKFISDFIFREIKQNIGRVLRHKNDYANFLSPDLKLLNFIPHVWGGNIIYA